MNELPRGWVLVPLKAIVKVEWGNTSITKKAYVPNGYPAFSATGKDGFLPRFEWTGPAVILSAIGARCGKCFYADGEWTAIKNTIVLQGNRTFLDHKLLYYYLNDENGWEISGTGQPFITMGSAQKRIYPLAPLNEQRRIVAKLENLLSVVNSAQQRLATIPRTLKRFRQSVLADACLGRLTAEWRNENRYSANSDSLIELENKRKQLWNLRLQKKIDRNGSRSTRANPKYKPPFEADAVRAHEFPETWAVATVSQLALLDVGFAFKSAEFETSGIRLLRGENIEPGSLRWHDVRFWPEAKMNGHEHLLVEEGEIILAMDRPVISTGLKIARAKSTDLPCLLVQRVTRFKMVEPRMTNFLYYNLQLNEFIENLSTGLTGSDLPHVTGEGLAKYTIGLPPLEEQEEIVHRVEALFKTADELEARYLKAKAYIDKLKQSILAKAFRGELVPQNPNDEPASVLLERITSGPNGSDSINHPTKARKRPT